MFVLHRIPLSESLLVASSILYSFFFSLARAFYSSARVPSLGKGLFCDEPTYVYGENQSVLANCRGDSCNGGEAHARSNKMRARERKKENRG